MRNDKKVRILKSGASSFLDYPDNKSLAIIVYILGCTHNCHDCQNPELQDINYTDNITEITTELFVEYIRKLSNKYKTNKLILSGGDPLYPDNIDFVKEFLKSTDLDVCIYTGYSVDYVKDNCVSDFKFLKCGKHISTLSQRSVKTDEYLQFSSKNQKLYDKDFKLISKDGRYYFY